MSGKGLTQPGVSPFPHQLTKDTPVLITANPPLRGAAHRAMSSLAELVAFVEDDSIPEVTRAYALCVEYGWTSTPGRSLDREEWVRLFTSLGFITNEIHLTRPSERTRLYRAATPEYARGLSWTDSLAYAQLYLTRNPAAGEHHLYTCVIEPEWVLALVQRTQRNGQPRAVEWIVNLPDDAPYRLEDTP